MSVTQTDQVPMWEELAKEEGQRLAMVASIHWQTVAKEWVASLPRGTTVTSDDVTGHLGVPPSQGAVGALFSGLAKQGVVRMAGVTTSRREGRHGSMVRRWVRA